MDTYRKLISSTLRDLRTVQVKIFDRLDNMRDLGYLPRLRQRQISTETMNVYVPMAQRLGLQVIADELGVRPEDVKVTPADSPAGAHATAPYASRSTVLAGGAATLASRAMRWCCRRRC